MREDERKVFEVWKDNEKRAEWFLVLRTNDRLLRKLMRDFEARDLPAELIGTTAYPIVDDRGQVVYRFRSALEGIASCAVAELVDDHGPEQITEAMITNRVNARLIDAVRDSEEFGQPRRKDENGNVRRPTERLTPKKTEPRYPSDRRVTEDRALAAVERQQRLKELTSGEQSVWLAYQMARQSSVALAGVFNTVLENAGYRSPYSGEDWPRFTREEMDSFSRTSHQDAVAAVHALLDDTGFAVPGEIEPLLRSALRKMGEPGLPELLDVAPEPVVEAEDQ